MSLSKVYKSQEGKKAELFIVNPVRPLKDSNNDEDLNAERDGYEKGYRAGEKAGMEFGKEKVNGLIRRLSSIIEEFLAFRERYYTDKEKELIELVIAVAEKVVHAELSINRDVVVNVMKAAISSVTNSEDLLVRVNPDDLEYIKEFKPDFLEKLKEVKRFTIEGDPSIRKGGAIIESNHGEIDARIEEGLRTMERVMKEVSGR